MIGLQFSSDCERVQVYQWVNDLDKLQLMDNALSELSLRRQSVSDLASILWHTPKAIDVIMNVIVSAPVNPPTSMHPRLLHALSLLQTVAKHPSTQLHFLQSQFLKYIPLFLENLPISSDFEHLRCEGLDVIVALDQINKHNITYLLTTGIIPLCLKIIKDCQVSSQITATIIFKKFLSNEMGLHHICHTFERFEHVVLTLGQTVLALETNLLESCYLFREILDCYNYLTKDTRVCEALNLCISSKLKKVMMNMTSSTDTDPAISAKLKLLLNSLKF